jgi:hypothetical protein
VNRSDHTLKFLGHRGEGLASAGRLCRFLFLLFLVGVVACGTTWSQSTPVNSVRPTLPFAVADFDGDLRPDLADIQIGQSNASHTEYWIQLQLSAIGRQSILVVAPSGGLQISARDVNGDNVPDLVLTTTWLRKPVAIFLNDGHGGFSRVDPSFFPEAFTESKSKWGSVSQQSLDAAVVPPKSRDGICSAAIRIPHLGSAASAVPVSNCGTLLHSPLFSYQGRAPPSELPQL